MYPQIMVAVLALSLGVAIWLLLAGPDPARARSLTNLARGLGAVEQAAPSRSQRRSILDSPKARSRYEAMLARAGYPDSWTVDKLLSAKLVLAVVVGALAFVVTRDGSPMMMLGGVAFTVLAFFTPDLLLHSRGQERTQAINLELADTLDQMSIAVNAGLGFDAAMQRVAKQGRGPLAHEMIRTLQEIRVGQARRVAYEDLAQRAGSVQLRRFVRTIVQAEAYGLPLTDVLHTQSDDMRKTRRQTAEKKAMEIPVKVIFPLMLTILPVLFIVIMGPAVISIMDTFSNL
ncbi:MAG: type II secretion system F family protein [Arachnia sp.]